MFALFVCIELRLLCTGCAFLVYRLVAPVYWLWITFVLIGDCLDESCMGEVENDNKTGEPDGEQEADGGKLKKARLQ